MPLDRHRKANLASWDEIVPVHVSSAFYDVEGFKRGRCSLSPLDVEAVGDVRGRSLLHLQCHFGMDSLSWARRGARVTGVDFSPRAVEAAVKLSRETGIEARFVCTELYDTPAALGERFDIVFTSAGALCWLPSVDRWARVVADCLRPGGLFYLREGHPVLWSLDERTGGDELRIGFPYFETEEPMRFEDGLDYASDYERKNRVTYEWNHGLGEIVTALIRSGLRIEFLHEHRCSDWKALPQMVRGEDRMWRLPEHAERLPLMYSIRAVRGT